MKNLTTAAALALAFTVAAGVSNVAAQENSDGKKYDKGASVTLQGCVTAAQKKDTYVLTGVKEWPAATAPTGKYGPRYYWIDKGSKELKPHLGHSIQITGKITGVEKSEAEVKTGENGVGTVVEIEGPGRDVITSKENAKVNPNYPANSTDIKVTLLRLKIEDLKMLSSTCAITSSQQ
jgi:hypothetical protein